MFLRRTSEALERPGKWEGLHIGFAVTSSPEDSGKFNVYTFCPARPPGAKRLVRSGQDAGATKSRQSAMRARGSGQQRRRKPRPTGN
jgi:hypothetical protein